MLCVVRAVRVEGYGERGVGWRETRIEENVTKIREENLRPVGVEDIGGTCSRLRNMYRRRGTCTVLSVGSRARRNQRRQAGCASIWVAV
jgi:hypothetical protein